MRLKPVWRTLLPWLLLAVLGGVLFMFYIQSSVVDDKARSQVELDMRQILALDTRINLDVLRLRHRQLQGYDSLANSALQVTNLLQGLQRQFERMGRPEALASARQAWLAKETALDDFKRQNTVLVNSLYHFVNLSRQLQTTKEGSVDLLNAITRDVLVFVNEQQTEEIPAIFAHLEQLEAMSKTWSGMAATRGSLLAAHARQIVNNHLPVQRLMLSISRNHFTQDLELAYGEYIRAYNQATVQAEYYRRLMAIFSLLMVVAVVLIVLRLQYTARELESSHSLLDNIANHLGEGIFSFDGEGRLNFMNRRAEHLLGRREADLLGRDLVEIWPRESQSDSAFRAARQAGRSFEGEEWLCRASGEHFPAFFLGGPLPNLDDANVAQGYVASFRDVTAQHQSEERLRIAASVFDSLAEAMTIAGPDGRIISINPAFSQITGFSEADARGKTPGELLGSGLHDKEFFREMWRSLNESDHWQGEIINRRKNGETYPEWLSITAVRNEEGDVAQYIALFSDISERKQVEARIHRLSYHDLLTGLANRLLFQDRLETAVRQAHRSHRPLAVILFDLDHFKNINDSLEHRAGDSLLSAVGQRIQALLHEGDTLARLSGDEFAILLPDGITSHADAAKQASLVMSAFATPFELEGREIHITVSIGIAVYPADGETWEVLLKNADVALHNAKSAGRATFRFFQESDNQHSLERLELENDLRHAIRRNELRLYYQPQVDTHSGMIYGVEALCYWQHPTRGLLMPHDFISLAENSGYIDALGRWCLENGCRQLVEWQRSGLPIQWVAINVSARQFRNPGFTEMVLEIVEATGINPNCLELELTESSMADDPERIFNVFTQLRKKGLRIAIDDFGTGYSSLSYLARYPVDVVKIDKSFVDGIAGEGEQNSFSLVQAVVLMAHTLHMKTVAEGVENEEQRRCLMKMQCDLLQGYLYSRPCLASALIDLPCVADND
ncbi:MAG: EAL domain-containing protein [Zoogloeaceae bacterium]|jgi:diguanylate cyclase (GGDEF)-like protein/PAS domain S-box-containing protein|nr:EAL domain-containing protein [Zoogloeaceae bacterium]